MFPVEIVRDEKPMDLRPDNSRLIRAVERGLQESSGNILVFLPGEREIISFLEDLERSRVPDKGVQLYPLFSRLKPAEQDRVLNHKGRPYDRGGYLHSRNKPHHSRHQLCYRHGP